MHVLVVEDDKLQYEFIKRALERSTAFQSIQVERIVTESEFRRKFEKIAERQPDVIIMDIMLRWTDPSPDMELPPKEIADQGFFRAGVRCEQMLANDSRTNNIPIMIYSVLDREDFGAEITPRPEVSYLEKNFDIEDIETRIKGIEKRQTS